MGITIPVLSLVPEICTDFDYVYIDTTFFNLADSKNININVLIHKMQNSDVTNRKCGKNNDFTCHLNTFCIYNSTLHFDIYCN